MKYCRVKIFLLATMISLFACSDDRKIVGNIEDSLQKDLQSFTKTKNKPQKQQSYDQSDFEKNSQSITELKMIGYSSYYLHPDIYPSDSCLTGGQSSNYACNNIIDNYPRIRRAGNSSYYEMSQRNYAINTQEYIISYFNYGHPSIEKKKGDYGNKYNYIYQCDIVQTCELPRFNLMTKTREFLYIPKLKTILSYRWDKNPSAFTTKIFKEVMIERNYAGRMDNLLTISGEYQYKGQVYTLLKYKVFNHANSPSSLNSITESKHGKISFKVDFNGQAEVAFTDIELKIDNLGTSRYLTEHISEGLIAFKDQVSKLKSYKFSLKSVENKWSLSTINNISDQESYNYKKYAYAEVKRLKGNSAYVSSQMKLHFGKDADFAVGSFFIILTDEYKSLRGIVDDKEIAPNSYLGLAKLNGFFFTEKVN